MVKEELKIVRWLQFMRVTEHAMKRLFTKQELEQINREAKHKVLAFDENQNKVIVVNADRVEEFVDRSILGLNNSERGLIQIDIQLKQ